MADTALDEKTREIASALSANPMDLIQGQLKGYMEDFIRVTVGSNVNTVLQSVYAIGHFRIVPDDLTAQTGVYVYSDVFGDFLYMNGAAASQTTYAELYAAWGANKWGADSGGNFILGDSRGRGLFMCGTHANAGLGDNDGAAVADRQAKHSHASTDLTITGAPGVGTLAAAPSGGGSFITSAAATANLTVGGGSMSTDAAATITGAPSAGTLDVGGTAGTGTTGDAPAHLFIGSLLVRF
jgi:hypothetical protein